MANCNWPSHHDVLLVTLKQGGEAWYIDLTYAQYGFQGPLTPVKDFWGPYGVKRSKHEEFGTAARRYQHLDSPIDKLLWDAQECLNEAIDKWALKNMSLADLVHYSYPDFEKRKLSLLHAMGEAVRQCTPPHTAWTRPNIM